MTKAKYWMFKWINVAFFACSNRFFKKLIQAHVVCCTTLTCTLSCELPVEYACDFFLIFFDFFLNCCLRMSLEVFLSHCIHFHCRTMSVNTSLLFYTIFQPCSLHTEISPGFLHMLIILCIKFLNILSNKNIYIQ